MRRSALLGLWVCLAGAAFAAESTPSVIAPGIDFELPGPVLDITATGDPADPALFLLVRPIAPGHDAGSVPTELWRLTAPPEQEPSLTRIRNDLDAEARKLIVSRTGDHAKLLLPLSGRLVELDDRSEPIVLESAALRPRSARLWRAPGTGREILSLTELAGTRLLEHDAPDGWREVATLERQPAGHLRRHELQVASRREEGFADRSGALHFATPPVAVSPRRLRGERIALDAGEARRVSWWAGLPEEEELLEHAFVVLDGEPALIVTTRPTAKLALFGEKHLRVFRLREDRSRMGHPPLFAVKTRINLWQHVRIYVRDVDGDGREDLLLAYWKGLKDDRIAIDAYAGNVAGIFDTSPRTTAFDVRNADRGYLDFGGDVDGDGRPDLLLRAGKELQLFHGSGSLKAIVATRPTRVVPLSAAPSADEQEIEVSVGGGGVHPWEAVGAAPRPERHDLDGDGVDEVVHLAPLADGSLRLTLVRFRR